MGSELDRDGHARPLSVTRLVSLGSSPVVAAVLACHSGAIAAPAGVCPVSSGAPPPAPAPAPPPPRPLVFSRPTRDRPAPVPAAPNPLVGPRSLHYFAVAATGAAPVLNNA